MAQATYQDYIKAIASRIPAGRIYTDRVLQKAGYGILFPAEMKNLCCDTPMNHHVSFFATCLADTVFPDVARD
jgi:Fe-S oxidoreductase